MYKYFLPTLICEFWNFSDCCDLTKAWKSWGAVSATACRKTNCGLSEEIRGKTRGWKEQESSFLKILNPLKHLFSAISRTRQRLTSAWVSPLCYHVCVFCGRSKGSNQGHCVSVIALLEHSSSNGFLLSWGWLGGNHHQSVSPKNWEYWTEYNCIKLLRSYIHL